MLDSKGEELATYVKQVYPLKNKDVAVATSGYGIMIKKKDAQECHAMKGEVEKLKYIHKLLEDKRGRLWIITEDGKLYRKETNGRVTSHFVYRRRGRTGYPAGRPGQPLSRQQEPGRTSAQGRKQRLYPNQQHRKPTHRKHLYQPQ